MISHVDERWALTFFFHLGSSWLGNSGKSRAPKMPRDLRAREVDPRSGVTRSRLVFAIYDRSTKIGLSPSRWPSVESRVSGVYNASPWSGCVGFVIGRSAIERAFPSILPSVQ